MSTFNPKQHLINLERKGSKPARNYLPAKARIMWLRHKDSHQDVNIKFGIETELIEHERDVMVRAESWNDQSRKQEVEQVSASVVIFKATIRDEEGRILATGYKQENSYNFLDYLEKSETGSIARALSVLGFGTEFALELELDLDGNRIADAPVTESKPSSQGKTTQPPSNAQPAMVSTPTNGKPSTDLPPRITKQQIKDILKLMDEKGLSRDDFMSKWGSLKVMSKELAGEVLTELMSYTAPQTAPPRQSVEIPF